MSPDLQRDLVKVAEALLVVVELESRIVAEFQDAPLQVPRIIIYKEERSPQRVELQPRLNQGDNSVVHASRKTLE